MQFSLFLIVAGVVLVVSAHPHQSQYSNTILVVESGDDNQSGACPSFECITESLSNSTEVIFSVTEIILTTTVRIENYNNIAFIGGNATTTLTCDPPTGSKGAGLIFNAVTDLVIAGITVSGCGSQWQNGYNYSSAIYIHNSVNFQFQNITIRNSNGRGLMVSNTHGNVSVKDSHFIRNKLQTPVDTYGGGGVYLNLTHKLTESNVSSQYVFSNCTFFENNATINKGVGYGGGIFVRVLTSRHHVLISGTKFINNSAVWGGGCLVAYYGLSNGNNFTITDSLFHNNQVTRAGGALDIGYKSNNATVPHSNNVLVNSCKFTSNHAAFGGAVSIFSSKSKVWFKHQDLFEFRNCGWYNNSVTNYGSAVDISPDVYTTLTRGWIPVLPVFENCIFQQNQQNYATNWEKGHTGRGIFYATSFTVQIQGNITFTDNGFSAMYLVSSTIIFRANTNATFINNTGLEGGAIALIGFSALHVNDNSTFNFTGNKAEKGGALYYWSIDRHDYISTRSCFIQYKGSSLKDMHNIFMFFSANQAQYGNSIFATSILPCHFICNGWGKKPEYITQPFSCIGEFKYSDEEGSEFSTSGGQFHIDTKEDQLGVIPGRKTQLPIKLEDDFGTAVNATYHVEVIPSAHSNIAIDSAHSYIHENRLEVFGKPNDSGTIVISTILDRMVSLAIQVKMLECPPGFILSAENTTGSTLYKCICSVNSNINFIGITKCNMSEFQAYIDRKYWVGYENNIVSYDNLLIGYCPIGLCGQTYSQENSTSIHLPQNASNEALDDRICGNHRTGVLCSMCRDDYAVHYHACGMYCGKKKSCRFGWLFYVLSELLPLTVIFAVIIIFNISFTSGVANAFILFAQIFDTRIVTADGSIWVNDTNLWYFLRAIHFIYRFFNFEFFTEKHFSFCLWEGASSMDIIAFKYVTMAYGLSLPVVTVVLVNTFKCSNRLSPGRIQNSIIHGMTAFLVLCYSHCAQVTFQILTPTTLYAVNRSKTVATYNGQVSFMRDDHLKYAIPAIFCLLTVVLLPPLLLVSYPAYSRLFSLLKLNDTKFAQFVSLRIERFKPLFDSFQGCYKDEYRFFAGYYFVVRLLSEVTDAFTQENSHYYAIMNIIFIATIILYLLCRPYKKNWHNVLDGFIIADLLIINVLASVCGYVYTPVESDVVISIQALLSLLPLLYIIIYCFTSFFGVLLKNKPRTEAVEEFELPARLLPEEEYNQYRRYEEVL